MGNLFKEDDLDKNNKSSGSSEKQDKQKPHYIGHRKRLKTKFLKSLNDNSSAGFEDYEILEIILFSAYPRQDVKPIAKKLLNQFGSLSNIMQASVKELKVRCELGDSAISMIKAVNELLLRSLKEEISEQPILRSWQAVLDYCHAAMGNSKKEEFRVLFLDKKNKLIADEVQQRGTVDQTPVYPREVIKRSLEYSASAIILIHNHPSGDPSPSKADIEVTEQIESGLKPLSIKLHDHLIIAGKRHFSFAGNGLIV